MRCVDLYWLPVDAALADTLRRLGKDPAPQWSELVQAANTRLDFLQTNRLDKILQRAPQDTAAKSLKLALLSSSTADHLLPGLRVGAARRNFRLQTFLGDYGMYLAELQDRSCALHQFQPNILLFAFHAQHLFGGPDPTASSADADAKVDAPAARVEQAWTLARESFSGQIIQQSVVAPEL